MDDLEILIRDTLVEHAGDAPPVSVLSGRSARSARPARRWVPVVAAAAAVAAIAVGAAVLAARHGSGSDDASTAPPGTKPVSFHGITIDVPTKLRITNGQCRPEPDVVLALDPTGILECGNIPLHPTYVPVGGTEVGLAAYAGVPKQIATDPIVVNGLAGRIGWNHNPARYTGITGTLYLADPGVEIDVTAPTRSAVERILRTVVATPTDHLGCVSHVPSLVPSGNPPASTLVPGHPVSAVVCAYGPDSERARSTDSPVPQYWLFQSAALSARLTRAYAQSLASTSTSPGNGFDGSEVTSVDWIVFHYANGSTRAVAAPNHFEGGPWTDGNQFGGNDVATRVGGLPD